MSLVSGSRENRRSGRLPIRVPDLAAVAGTRFPVLCQEETLCTRNLRMNKPRDPLIIRGFRLIIRLSAVKLRWSILYQVRTRFFKIPEARNISSRALKISAFEAKIRVKAHS